MIENNLKLEIDGKIILNNISFKINLNEKVGLVGKNGSGKTSLLKTIHEKNKNTSYLKQEIEEKYYNLSITEYIKTVTNLKLIEEKLNHLSFNLNDNNTEEYNKILNEYLILDGYNFENNINTIKNGLKLNKSLNTKINELSGGEKIKVLLIQVLLENKDILLLDEPTNNLDSEAIIWLENYLKKSKKTIIIISHDEVFLNNTVSKIFELKDGYLKEYNMSYNDYLILKENDYKKEKEEYLRIKNMKKDLKEELEKAKRWVNIGNNKRKNNDNDKIANNYKKEKTNTSNIKRLTKIIENTNIPTFEEKPKLNIFFMQNNDKGNKDIILKDLVCGYKNFKTKSLSVVIPFKSKVRINGKNGSGKTTLVKTIVNEIKPISGEIILGTKVNIGYISQNTLNDSDQSIIEYITNNQKEIDYTKLYTLLDKLNIKYENKDKKYYKLSPGERTRVNIAKLIINNINVLILDEITNHLDKEALELIYELINTFNGTIISISHNRKFNEILNANITIDLDSD